MPSSERVPALTSRPSRRKASKPSLNVALIDRDGTLIHEPEGAEQIDSLALLKILPGVTKGLKLLKDNSYKLWLVSNQDGLGTDSFPSVDFWRPHYELCSRLARNGLHFEREFICPHMPDVGCDCRKPKTGMFDALLERVTLEETSFVMGDRSTDVGLARNLGIGFVKMELNGNFYDSLISSEIGQLLVGNTVEVPADLRA